MDRMNKWTNRNLAHEHNLFVTDLPSAEWINFVDFLLLRKLRLELTIRLLQQKESMTACCDICWTLSWAPCDKDTPDAIADPFRTGEYMVCQMCAADNYIARIHTELEEARRLISASPIGGLPDAVKIIDRIVTPSEG